MRNNKLIIRIFAFIVAIAFIAVSLLTVFPLDAGAETAQSKLEDAQKKQEEIQQQIKNTDEKISANTAEKKKLDTEINHVQAEIDSLNSRINDINEKIANNELELEAAEKDSQEQFESYKARASLMIERGGVSYLEVILQSKSFSDLLSRITFVKEIAKYDSEKLAELKKIEEKIQNIKQELEQDKNELVTLRQNEEKQMSALAQKRSESQSIIDSLKNDKSAFEAALKEQEAAEAAARAEIARLAQSSSSSGTQYSGGVMAVPAGGPITSYYGWRIHPVTGKQKLHTGMDFGAAYGTDIIAAEAGTVIVAGYNTGGYGNYVVIDHGGGVTTLYGHASSLCVSSGQYVSRGQVIAKVGSTGMSTGPHLHFEVLINGAHTDPLNYLN